MSLHTQSAALLPAQENLVQRSTKTVSFQTPGGAANKKSKTAGRRAFGDISNRKQPQSQSSKSQVTKPSQSKATSIRLERKPSIVSTAPKAKASSTTKSTQKAKREVYEEIELPYGPTGSQLDELYDSDGHISVCSMEKEGFVFSRQDVADLFRQGFKERREEEDRFLDSTWKSMNDENAALARKDEEFVKSTMVINISEDNNSILDALNDLSLALSDDEDDFDLSIPL